MSVIYEKHYPHPTFEEEMKELEEYEKEMESSPDYIPEPEMTFDEFYILLILVNFHRTYLTHWPKKMISLFCLLNMFVFLPGED